MTQTTGRATNDRLSIDTNLPRAPVAVREGLHAGFGFPVMLHGDVFGVMEFFSRDVHEPDEQLLPMLSTVGSQMGAFIAHQRAQSELTQLVELCPDTLCQSPQPAICRRWNAQ
jgi:GAF domain-containing protein